MERVQILPEVFVYVLSRNPIALWTITARLSQEPKNWRVTTCLPRPSPIVLNGVHILLIDIASILEWPETVRNWTAAGYKTILMAAENWGTDGAGLRALRLGVRGIVHVSSNFPKQLPEAVGVVARGQLFARGEGLLESRSGLLDEQFLSFMPGLTSRERQVMDLLSLAFSNRRIGKVLGISERTAKFHVGNILRKLQMTTRKELLYNDELCSSGKGSQKAEESPLERTLSG